MLLPLLLLLQPMHPPPLLLLLLLLPTYCTRGGLNNAETEVPNHKEEALLHARTRER